MLFIYFNLRIPSSVVWTFEPLRLVENNLYVGTWKIYPFSSIINVVDGPSEKIQYGEFICILWTSLDVVFAVIRWNILSKALSKSQVPVITRVEKLKTVSEKFRFFDLKFLFILIFRIILCKPFRAPPPYKGRENFQFRFKSRRKVDI